MLIIHALYPHLITRFTGGVITAIFGTFTALNIVIVFLLKSLNKSGFTKKNWTRLIGSIEAFSVLLWMFLNTLLSFSDIHADMYVEILKLKTTINTQANIIQDYSNPGVNLSTINPTASPVVGSQGSFGLPENFFPMSYSYTLLIVNNSGKPNIIVNINHKMISLESNLSLQSPTKIEFELKKLPPCEDSFDNKFKLAGISSVRDPVSGNDTDQVRLRIEAYERTPKTPEQIISPNQVIKLPISGVGTLAGLPNNNEHQVALLCSRVTYLNGLGEQSQKDIYNAMIDLGLHKGGHGNYKYQWGRMYVTPISFSQSLK